MLDTIENARARNACRMFMKTDRLHRKAFEVLVSRLGIHRSQHILLMHVSHGCGMSQAELAEHLEISPAAVAVSLKKLEVGGYIKKMTAQNDCRCNEIQITEKGREIVNASERFFCEIDAAMLKGVDEKMLDNFVKCLEIMQNNLKELCGGEAEYNRGER